MITSSDNKIIKQAKKLHLVKNRKKEELFLAEGVNVAIEAFKAELVKTCLIAEDKESTLIKTPGLGDYLKSRQKKIFIVEKKLFSVIAPTDNSQGIVAICHLSQNHYKDNFDDLESFGSLIPALDGVSDPGNCGAIIRMAVGMGFKDIVVLGDSADPFGPKVVRASSGYVMRANIYYSHDTVSTMNKLSEMGYNLLVTDAGGEHSLKEYDFPKKSVLVFGGEARGVSPEVREMADDSIYIPISKDVDSFNVAAAAGIFFYEYRKNIGSE